MKRWKESEVDRDDAGRFRSSPRGSARTRAIKSTAAEKNDLEDRRDARLRWGSKALAGVWFMPKGPSYWVPRGKHPETIRGNYYIPSSPWPTTPPRKDWPAWNSYSGIAGQTPLSRLVPDDIWQAGQGKLGPGPGESSRKDVQTARRRAALGPGDAPPKKGVTRIGTQGRR